MTDPTERYFAYGSNLDVQQMAERCPAARPLFRARLLHHRIDFTHFSSRWRGGAADVVPHFDAMVWGIVYALDPADLILLDRYEGGYERVVLSVRDDSDREVRVSTYTVRRKGAFRPTPVYLRKMLRSAGDWAFPPEYLAELRGYSDS